MTCVSERSGSASTGVRTAERTPAATRNAVAMRTRNRLTTDQRMRAAITWHLPGMRRGGSRRRRSRGRLRHRHVAEHGTQASLRVDEELAAGDHLVAFVQALDDLQRVAQVGAEHHLARLEAAVVLADDGHRAGPGADDRLRGHHQARQRRAGDLQAQQHPGHEPAALVVDLEARLQRARAGVDLRKDLLHLAGEGLRGIGLQHRLDLLSPRQADRLRLRHLGHRPDLLEAGDAEQRHPGGDGHAFANAQLGHHAAGRSHAARSAPAALPPASA